MIDGDNMIQGDPAIRLKERLRTEDIKAPSTTDRKVEGAAQRDQSKDQRGRKSDSRITGSQVMGTKLKPGRFDCWAAALPDEPLFVLLARDIEAPRAIEHWADLRARRIKHGKASESDAIMIEEANRLAQEMRDWRALANEKWKTEKPQVDTVAKSYGVADFADAILRDILVNVFENDGNVAEHLERYKPQLIKAIQQWGEIKTIEAKTSLLESVRQILPQRGVTPSATPVETKPGVVYIPPKPPVMKPVIEGPQFVYTKGALGPVAEIWHEEKQRESEMPVAPLQRHQMTEEDRGKTIEELKVIYPFKGTTT